MKPKRILILALICVVTIRDEASLFAAYLSPAIRVFSDDSFQKDAAPEEENSEAAWLDEGQEFSEDYDASDDGFPEEDNPADPGEAPGVVECEFDTDAEEILYLADRRANHGMASLNHSIDSIQFNTHPLASFQGFQPLRI